MITPEEKKKARAAAKRVADNLPLGTQFVIANVLPNIPNGCNWGFVTESAYLPYAEDIEKNPNFGVVKLGGNEVLITTDVNYFFQLIHSVTGEGTILTKDLKEMARLQNDAVADLTSLLATRGADYLNGGTICIYNLNEVNKTSFGKITIPAFKVSIQTLLNTCKAFNYGLQIEGKWLSPNEAAQYGTKMFASTKVADSRHGIMINIRYMGTAETAKAMRTAYKKQYKLQ